MILDLSLRPLRTQKILFLPRARVKGANYLHQSPPRLGRQPRKPVEKPVEKPVDQLINVEV
jgi:hypothetical protein